MEYQGIALSPVQLYSVQASDWMFWRVFAIFKIYPEEKTSSNYLNHWKSLKLTVLCLWLGKEDNPSSYLNSFAEAEYS